LERIQNEKALKSVPNFIKKLLAFLFIGTPPHIMLAPKLFSHLRRRGIAVIFMNVNDEKNIQMAVECGATAVLTDKINWLCKYVKDKNIKFKQIE
jgi:hypothetical protein